MKFQNIRLNYITKEKFWVGNIGPKIRFENLFFSLAPQFSHRVAALGHLLAIALCQSTFQLSILCLLDK